MIKIYGIENYEAFAANNGMGTLEQHQISSLKRREAALNGILSVCDFSPAFRIGKHSPSDAVKLGYKSEYYLASWYGVVFYNGVALVPVGHSGSSKLFSFYLDVESKSNFLQSFCYDDFNFNAPQRVGSATSEKLDRWVSYLQSIEQAKVQHIADIQDKIDTFKSELAKYGDLVRYYSDQKNSGEVRLGGLIYDFSISESGHIEQQITTALRLSETTIDNFMLMADNKYNK